MKKKPITDHELAYKLAQERYGKFMSGQSLTYIMRDTGGAWLRVARRARRLIKGEK